MMREADVVTKDPLNMHSSWAGLQQARTPTSEFYTRNNNPVPTIRADAWRLPFLGFAREHVLDLATLRTLPTRSLDVVLECAGNARTSFDPVPGGTAWDERAVGCARFTGAPLRLALDAAGVPAGTEEIVFTGGDVGGEHTFERSLPLEVARDDDTLLVWAMNDAPLEPRHGAPVRLVVPRWYGVASVKWLVGVRASSEPFRGHFQTERYVYERTKGDPDATPVREKRVNSVIATPPPDASAQAGAALEIRGWAWSGHAPIARVEASTDGGASWTDAALDAPLGPYAWRGWRLATTARAGMRILSRATDEAGNVQPEQIEWNAQGYGYNAPRPRDVRVA